MVRIATINSTIWYRKHPIVGKRLLGGVTVLASSRMHNQKAYC